MDTALCHLAFHHTHPYTQEQPNDSTNSSYFHPIFIRFFLNPLGCAFGLLRASVPCVVVPGFAPLYSRGHRLGWELGVTPRVSGLTGVTPSIFWMVELAGVGSSPAVRSIFRLMVSECGVNKLFGVYAQV